MDSQPADLKVGAGPFSSDGGPVGVLLIHGFTGSPASMAPWGHDLAERGLTVRVPRLPGHGTTWQQMNRTRWQDWYGEVDQALTELRERCEHVAVAGLSMGGCLALRLAQQRPGDVDALVLVNPAVALRRFDLKLVPALQHLLPSMPGIGNDIARPGADEVAYDKTPLRALASQLHLWKDVRAGLDRVVAPVQLFRSEQDHVVDDWSQHLILEGVSSTVTELVTLADSFHVATLDHDAPRIFADSAAFIDLHTRGTTDG